LVYFGMTLTHPGKNLHDRRAANPGRPAIHQSKNGAANIEVCLEGNIVSLPQRARAELFRITKRNISLHIQHIFVEADMSPEATVKQCLTAQTEANRQIRRAVDHHNLDLIIAVGYPGRNSTFVIPTIAIPKAGAKRGGAFAVVNR
jgi:hypothetical protein